MIITDGDKIEIDARYWPLVEDLLIKIEDSRTNDIISELNAWGIPWKWR